MERLSAENIRSDFQEIYRFGCRWLDTEGERNTRQSILTKFEDSSMDNVYCEWFQCHRYVPKECRLEVLSPISLDIRCEPLEYSENSEIEGELIFLGEFNEGNANTISKTNMDLEGKISLIVSDTPAFYISELIEKGAAGVIVATDAPDNLIRTLAAKSYPPNLKDPLKWKVKIPGVSISKQDLYKLLSYMSLGKVTVKIEHFWDSRISQTCNIVGIVEGGMDESIVVGAHYDSQIKTPGAWDNLTGVSTLLNLARIFGKAKNRRRIIFVAFGAEEIGLWGS
ncbi:MAG: M28 family peptidase, partial [Nitrososphaerota archaeon]